MTMRDPSESGRIREGGGGGGGGGGGRGSGTDTYNWQSKGAILLAQSISDPINCFCITVNGMYPLVSKPLAGIVRMVNIISTPFSILLGVLYLLGNSGDCYERSRVEGSIHSLLLNQGAQVLTVVTNEMLITQFNVLYDGQTTITTNVSKRLSPYRVQWNLHILGFRVSRVRN